MFRYASCRDWLEQELERRCSRNNQYSLRAFARDAGLSVSGLSQILSGKQGVSAERVVALADKLGATVDEIRYLRDLAASQYARSRKARELASARLEQPTPAEGQALALDAFRVVADWHHFAILELALVKGFKREPQWMSARLGISKPQVTRAIARLVRLGLLEETSSGSLRPTADFTFTPSGVPSDAIRHFHTQVLEKALSSLHTQPVEDRDFSSTMLAIRKKDLPEAQRRLRKMRREFCARLAASSDKDEVYCLSMQFFKVSEMEKHL